MNRVTNKAIASTTELQGARKGYTLIELVSSLVTASVLIGADGRVRKTYLGKLKMDELRRDIAGL